MNALHSVKEGQPINMLPSSYCAAIMQQREFARGARVFQLRGTKMQISVQSLNTNKRLGKEMNTEEINTNRAAYHIMPSSSPLWGLTKAWIIYFVMWRPKRF